MADKQPNPAPQGIDPETLKEIITAPKQMNAWELEQLEAHKAKQLAHKRAMEQLKRDEKASADATKRREESCSHQRRHPMGAMESTWYKFETSNPDERFAGTSILQAICLRCWKVVGPQDGKAYVEALATAGGDLSTLRQ